MKKRIESERGITLIALTITILVLLVLSAVAINSGISTIKSAKLTAFTAEMKLMQGKVNELYRNWKDGVKFNEDEVLNIGKKIEDADENVKNAAETAFLSANVKTEDRENYKYYDSDTLKLLGLEEVKGEFFVNIQKRSVISYNGFKDDEGLYYYTLEQLPRGLYNVEYNEKVLDDLKPNFGTKDDDLAVTEIGNGNFRISVSDRNYNKYIDKWKIKYREINKDEVLSKGEDKDNTDYKKVDTENKRWEIEGSMWSTNSENPVWNTSDDLSIIVNSGREYLVKIYNGEIESEKSVKVTIHAKPIMATANTEPYLPGNGKFERDNNTDLESGLVIEDENGNRYVWIEVPKKIFTNQTLKDKAEWIPEDYASVELDMIQYAIEYRSGGYSDGWKSGMWDSNSLLSSEEDYNKLKNKMLKSVYEHGGFWVSQFEIGTEEPRDGAQAYATPLSKEGIYPYRYISCTDAQLLAAGMYQGTDRTSSLMFGIQWDLILKYIETKGVLASKERIPKEYIKDFSTNWGNYRNAEFSVKRGKYLKREEGTWQYCYKEPQGYKVKEPAGMYFFTTGATDRNMVSNIYDLAGNVLEWTLEKGPDDTSPWTYRGGDLGASGKLFPVGKRESPGNVVWDCIGFRTVIF